MKFAPYFLSLLMILTYSGTSTAQIDDAARLEIESLKARIAALEARLDRQLARPVPPTSSSNTLDSNVDMSETGRSVAGGLGLNSANNEASAITVSGVVELEASYAKDYADESSSDLVVATVAVALDAQINDMMSASISLLYEEDDTDLEVDEAVLNFNLNENTEANIGQFYLPFGHFDTAMVNDTLVLELAETRETAAAVSYDDNGLFAQAYVFNGDIDKDNDTLTNGGIRLGYATDNWAIGSDWISNVSDSDGISAALDDAGVLATVDENVGATTLYVSANFGAPVIWVEYFKAGSFEASHFAGFITEDVELEALQVELAVDVSDWQLAASYQETNDAFVFGLPETRLAVAASREIFNATTLAAEVFYDKDYSVSDGGTGEHSKGAVVQLAVEF